VKLLGGEFDLPVGVNLVDADDVPAPASAGRPQAQGAGPKVGIHLLAAHPRLRRHALAEAADGVGVIPVEIFAHGLLFSAAAETSAAAWHEISQSSISQPRREGKGVFRLWEGLFSENSHSCP